METALLVAALAAPFALLLVAVRLRKAREASLPEDASPAAPKRWD